ncbi:aspartate carbamoyltransferase [Tropheryma whipplei]|uniref:aspartate carbamoyltransferase n=1 Tax=Tropheryma whipplei TaxID=2039 RepID=UPI0004B4C2E6|nr:aspartate carbamoyltransferase [Tropheryma whipplei]
MTAHNTPKVHCVIRQALRGQRIGPRQLAEQIGVDIKQLWSWLEPTWSQTLDIPQSILHDLEDAIDDTSAFYNTQHLLSIDQINRRSLERLFYVTDMFQPLARRQVRCNILNGAVLACLFYEASTRTRFSFSTAFSRMGGAVVTEADMLQSSSVAKGESTSDTSRVISGYADIVVVRHSELGFAERYASDSLVPVINAGDGSGEHPTQAILDVYTIESEFLYREKTIDGSCIAIIGDLKHGRTVHSLIKLLSLYERLTFKIFSITDLELPNDFHDLLSGRGHTLEVCDSLRNAVNAADVIYATRVQTERIAQDLTGVTGCRLTREVLDDCKKDVIVLHPLPRDFRPDALDIGTDLDSYSGFMPFGQANNGVPVRMAIFSEILGITDKIEFADSIPWARRIPYPQALP